jgi:hypothetical protein
MFAGLGPPARLDRRQRHRQIAIHALRTLVLCVEHEPLPPVDDEERSSPRHSGQLLFTFGRLIHRWLRQQSSMFVKRQIGRHQWGPAGRPSLHRRYPALAVLRTSPTEGGHSNRRLSRQEIVEQPAPDYVKAHSKGCAGRTNPQIYHVSCATCLRGFVSRAIPQPAA